MTGPDAEWLVDLQASAVHIPFFELVKSLLRRTAVSNGGSALGLGLPLRFAHDVRLIFHASDVVALESARGGERALLRLTTSFLGLVGAVSPLPTYFTEEILRAEGDDTTLRDFYDLLHNRLIGLHFRGMLRAAPAADLRLGGIDRTTVRSMASSGLASESLGTVPIPPRAWLAAAQVLGRRPRTRPALEEALAIALPHLSFRLEDFLPGFVAGCGAPAARVGMGELRLRRGVRIGRHARTQASGVRLLVGPVGGEQFRALLPGGRDFDALLSVVRATLASRSDAELEIEIRAGEEPRARVGARHGSRLRRGALVLREGRRARTVRARVTLTGGATGKTLFLVTEGAQ